MYVEHLVDFKHNMMHFDMGKNKRIANGSFKWVHPIYLPFTY